MTLSSFLNSGFNSDGGSGYLKKSTGAFFLFFCLLIFLPPPGTAQEKTLTTPLGMSFILVEPGTFMMGSPETERFRNADEPPRSVTIEKAFYLQTTEVTLGQWRAVMGKKWIKKRKGTDDMPVTQVSYYDCLKYIGKLNEKGMAVYRLPTDMEWEYACRAGTTTAYSWGDAIDCSKAMYGNNPKKDDECTLYFNSIKIDTHGPAPVKTFAPNPWGFYDMHGNVWEWCSDNYVPQGFKGYNPVDSNSHIRRGGSWYKYGYYLRSANRTYAHPGAKFVTTGFRLVREAD
ncbi:MAG: formylglycine-generating enzyme family protein [Deltaproteobacteria bacterium]|nr:MAG: formylglycine-generating enzyme family protein [Deltaproteobacteria bacterium]